MSNAKRIALVVFVIAVAVAAFVALKPGGNDSSDSDTTRSPSEIGTATGEGGSTTKPTPPRPSVTAIHLEGGKPAGGLAKIKVKKGEHIRLAVMSMDTKGEPATVHIHGYNFVKTLQPGGTIRFDFPATIEGIFEVELHAHPPRQLAEIEVQP